MTLQPPTLRGLRLSLKFHFGEDADHVIVNMAVGAEDLLVKAGSAAGEIGITPPSLGEDEKGCGNVVDIEVEFPEAFETTAGDVPKVDGCGAMAVQVLQFG